MTLKDYYGSLEVERPKPKKQFVQDVAEACNVETTTVRNWILYGVRPSNPRYTGVLSEKTGIPTNELWSNDSQVE